LNANEDDLERGIVASSPADQKDRITSINIIIKRFPMDAYESDKSADLVRSLLLIWLLPPLLKKALIRYLRSHNLFDGCCAREGASSISESRKQESMESDPPGFLPLHNNGSID
jgi:hypothetical protein